MVALWYGSCSRRHYLIKFATVNCHSPWPIYLLHRSDRGVKGRCGGSHQSCTFQSLMAALISAILLGMQYCFKFAIFPGRGDSHGFHFAFPTITTLTPQVMESMCEFCQYIYWNFRNNPMTDSANHWTLSHTSVQIPLIMGPPYPTLAGGPQRLLGFPGINVSLKPVFNCQ